MSLRKFSAMLALFLSTVAIASEPETPIFEPGDEYVDTHWGATGMLLLEQNEDGTVGEARIVQTEAKRTGGLRIVKSVLVGLPSPFLSASGRIGLETANQLLEVGVDGFVFYYPPREGAEGGGAGVYVNFAPIPGKWGRRFYLQGKTYLAFGFGRPTYNAWSAGFGLGYRHPFSAEADKSRYLFFEVGAERAWLFKYDEAVYMLDAARAGFRW